MENTLFVALSRQMVLRRSMDVIANNIANANTTGFQSEQLMFVDHLKPAGRRDEVAFVQDIGVAGDFSAGDLTSTGNPLDLAIQGKGWFVIETPQGERYTRNGRFHLDRDGQLVSTEGHPVLGEGGQNIVMAPDDTNIRIMGDGTIRSASGVKNLQIVSFDNEQLLRKISNGMYRTDALPKPAEEAKVVQGMVEGSNVEPIMEVTRMIQTLRDYQAAQKIVEAEHERQRRAIRTITQEA